jgi:phosphatidylinositol-3-phosphatase
MIKAKLVLILALTHMAWMMQQAAAEPMIKHVFTIVMENTDSVSIYGKTKRAPFINKSLMPKYARAANFNDPLPDTPEKEVPSEPHYIWMEAGTNVFSDYTFSNDDDSSTKNSTASGDHLVTQMKNSGTVTWMTYQEDITTKTGLCPIASNARYAAKHNPFVFFRDVSGSPPKKDNAYCIDHTTPYSSFAADLAADRMARVLD